MELVFHGGKCCGIKTIYGFHERPSDLAPEKDKKTFLNNDQHGHNVSTDKTFFTDAAPEETYSNRLDRYIEFCRKYRPQGIIEVTLADGFHIKQTSVWGKQLTRHGFKVVSQAKNSNTGNTVSVWHLVYDVPPKKRARPLLEFIREVAA